MQLPGKGEFMVFLVTFIRGLIMMFYITISTLFFSVLSILISLIFRAPDLAFEIDRYFWGRVALWLSGIQVEVRGLENLPQDGRGYLFLFNHTSYTDIIAMISWLPKMPRFGAKIELFKIPFFGAAMHSLGHIPIARDNRREVLKLYEEAGARVAKGVVFALAPEGTRQSGGELGKFKRGPFIFAVGAKMKVVPLLIVGAEQVQPKGSFLMNVGRWTRKIILQIQPSIDATEYTLENLSLLQERTKEQMAPQYQQLQKELGYK
ncbi:MAG: 1-acyl-sn-glycerol-3-phosphate acyltransferase [Bdellovibrionales bacterium]|nr:1-acyl-sn-glycerol-3-phosphate acyltransferase [Bdellovibrionales bacterium]